MKPKEIHQKLLLCPQIRITNRIRKSFTDWAIVGFWAKVNSNLGKDEKIEKVRQYIEQNNLPLKVINDPFHLTRIKLEISFRTSVLDCGLDDWEGDYGERFD